MVNFSFFLLPCQLPVTFHFPSSNYFLLKKTQLYERTFCLCSYKMIIWYSLTSLPIMIPKDHCRVHKSRVHPMHFPLTYLMTTDLNTILLLTPASTKKSLSLSIFRFSRNKYCTFVFQDNIW
jgi:hypothetical protein